MPAVCRGARRDDRVRRHQRRLHAARRPVRTDPGPRPPRRALTRFQSQKACPHVQTNRPGHSNVCLQVASMRHDYGVPQHRLPEPEQLHAHVPQVLRQRPVRIPCQPAHPVLKRRIGRGCDRGIRCSPTPAFTPLELPREVPRLGCHDCEGRADALELILRGLEGAQLSGAERTPAASEETQDEGPLRRSCSEEWRRPSASGRRKSARCLRPSTRAMHVCIAQPAHEVAV